jgi:ATP-dependent DNA helicase RecQ
VSTVDTEKSQFLNLFKVKEFQLINGEMIDIEKQDTLMNTFNNCKEETFQFIITATKKYPDSTEIICNLLCVNPKAPINPPAFMKTFEEVIKSAYDWSHDFNDFLFILEENSVKDLSKITEEVKAELLFVYSRDRDTANDTGRLIYRMHSMGFLEDYLIDYNKNNFYSCTFKKFKSIDKYTKAIEKYLRRYLSENTAMENIEALKSRLVKPTLVENIIECLYFLSEFSYKEIASKRKRATDEIENILNTSITEPNYVADWFQQNLYIKEQIYFYFNAKYARIGFKINGKPFSLLDDYQEQLKSKQEILDKYLEVYREDGTEQNNYKHMMGSCKKILRSLSETDLNNEWLLRLLKAFSMYSVNNASYISEANAELELGFDNLYKDESFHENNFDIIEPIFESYFTKLQSNIQEDNPSFKDIKLIRAKLLLKMQTLGIENLINKSKQLTEELYA